jgi:amino-acid N-acetyltransferase
MDTLSLKKAQNQDFDAAIQLLEKHQLPTSDIKDNVELYGIYEGDSMIGTIGLEAFNTEGLLRSVCIDAARQSKGLGTIILKKFEEKISQTGIQNLYLLTTTAKDFFEKNNYHIISRDTVPAAIKQTAEFTSVCPSSAIVMQKEL